MPIGPAPEPPVWWLQLTATQRASVIARLKQVGYPVAGWPK